MSEGPAGGKPSVNVVVKEESAVINGGHTFQLKITAHRTLRLHREYDQMVWDRCVALAHEGGHMPVGPVLVTDEDIEDPDQEALTEGVPLMLRGLLDHALTPLMLVTAEVEIGLSMGTPADEVIDEQDMPLGDAEIQRFFEEQGGT